MSVEETLMGRGRWSLALSPDTPRTILDILDPRVNGFGHIVITTNPVDVGLGDSILPLARYTGVYRRQESDFSFAGCGVAMWIGDEDDKGPGYAGGIHPVTGDFTEWVSLLKPTALAAGITSAVTGNYTQAYGHTLLSKPLSDVCSYFGVEWRVTNDFKFDIGRVEDLFRTTPEAIIVRKEGDGGRDLTVAGVVGDLVVERDVEDVVRRIILYSGDQAAPTITNSTSGISNNDYRYRNPIGGSIQIDQHVEDWNVTPGEEGGVVQGMFEQVRNAHEELTLSTEQYDIGADVKVGDAVWVFDPTRGIYDLTNPRLYRGQTVYPETIRCVGYTWPIRRGMGVYFRYWVKESTAWEVRWLDLTNFIVPETGDTKVDVGAKARG